MNDDSGSWIDDNNIETLDLQKLVSNVTFIDLNRQHPDLASHISSPSQLRFSFVPDKLVSVDNR